MDSLVNQCEEKHKRSHLGFELGSLIPFLITITVTVTMPLKSTYGVSTCWAQGLDNRVLSFSSWNRCMVSIPLPYFIIFGQGPTEYFCLSGRSVKMLKALQLLIYISWLKAFVAGLFLFSGWNLSIASVILGYVILFK